MPMVAIGCVWVRMLKGRMAMPMTVRLALRDARLVKMMVMLIVHMSMLVL